MIPRVGQVWTFTRWDGGVETHLVVRVLAHIGWDTSYGCELIDLADGYRWKANPVENATGALGWRRLT